MPLFYYINTMLINRILRAHGYIFTNNVDPRYLKMLVDLGSYPIIMYVDHKAHIKTPIIIYETNRLSLKDWNIMNYDCCTVSNIKQILSVLKREANIQLAIINPFYFQATLSLFCYAN